MSGANAPEVLAAYNDVRSDTSPTNWLLLSYASPTSDALTLTSTGTSGLAELAAAFDPTQAQYGYVRVEYENDKESKRVKFVFVVWIGEGCKVMRKAKVSIQSGEVRKVLSHHSITVDARELGDLDEEEIVKTLRKAGGANYGAGTR